MFSTPLLVICLATYKLNDAQLQLKKKHSYFWGIFQYISSCPACPLNVPPTLTPSKGFLNVRQPQHLALKQQCCPTVFQYFVSKPLFLYLTFISSTICLYLKTWTICIHTFILFPTLMFILYRLFHKTLPRYNASLNLISVRFYETDCTYLQYKPFIYRNQCVCFSRARDCIVK